MTDFNTAPELFAAASLAKADKQRIKDKGIESPNTDNLIQVNTPRDKSSRYFSVDKPEPLQKYILELIDNKVNTVITFPKK